MRNRFKRPAALLFAICLCLTMLLCFPVSAAAEEVQINNVLASLNYAPVVYMELQYVNVSTSGSGYYITGASWIGADGQPVSEQFGKGKYTLQVSYAVYDGYRFAADARGYINNSPQEVSLSVSADGTTAVLSRTWEAEIWAPVAIKNPGNAVVDVGGWTSFVVSSMYTEVDEWYMMDPNGKAYTMAEAKRRFSGIDYSGENSDKLILRNIPADMNGWSVFCRHWSVDRISYSDSKPGSITVKGATPTPAPTATPAPTPTPAPAHEGGGDGSGESGAADAAAADDGSAKSSEPVYLTTWSQDGNYHWHDSEDGALVSGRAAHSFVWREQSAPTATEDGEEEGVCSICGYTVTRALPATGESALSLSTYRVPLAMIGAGAGLGIISAVSAAILGPKKKKDK